MTSDKTPGIDIEKQPGFSMIRFTGFVDAATIEKAKPALEKERLADSANIIIDLSRVEFLDSHGVGFFVSLLKKMHSRQGRLVFVGAFAQPLSVLNMVGLNGKNIAYCDTLQQAHDLLLERQGEIPASTAPY